MNLPLLVAGSLALVAAAVHGVAGELLVVRRLSPRVLPASPFGGPGMTKAMIRASWHITTIAFLTLGSGLVLASSVLHGEAARGIGVLASAASSAIAAVVVAGALARSPRSLVRHPAPVLLSATAVLSWWGVASLGA